MPPTLSLREQILQNIIDSIAAITAGTDYNFTLARVERVTKPIGTIPEFPIVFVAGISENLEPQQTQQYSRVLNVEIAVWVQDQDNEGLATSKAIHDIEKKLMEDHTRGGLATDTNLISNSIFINEDISPDIAGNINLIVKYKTKYTDPSSII